MIVINEKYEPGNATQYDIQLVFDGKDITLTWFVRGGTGGISFRFDKWITVSEMLVSLPYFCEKFGWDNETDARALLERVALFELTVHRITQDGGYQHDQ